MRKIRLDSPNIHYHLKGFLIFFITVLKNRKPLVKRMQSMRNRSRAGGKEAETVVESECTTVTTAP